MCVFGFVAQLFSANPGTGSAYGACHLVGDPQPHAPHSTGRYPRWLHMQTTEASRHACLCAGVTRT